MTDGASATQPRLSVNEIYGPVVQGEGPHVGEPTIFLRLAGCNLACGGRQGDGAHGWVCDSAYTWNWPKYDREKEVHPMAIEAVLDQLQEMRTDPVNGDQIPLPHVVTVSGGEPLLQQAAVRELMKLAEQRDVALQWDFETNGTVDWNGRWRDPEPRTIVCSPKLPGSGNPRSALRHDVLTRLAAKGAFFKFVISGGPDHEMDWAAAEEIMQHARVPRDRVFMMPEGLTAEAVAKHSGPLMERCAISGYRFSPRLHITAYGNVRRR